MFYGPSSMYEWNLVIMVTGNTLVINHKHQVLNTLFLKMRIVSALYCLVSYTSIGFSSGPLTKFVLQSCNSSTV